MAEVNSWNSEEIIMVGDRVDLVVPQGLVYRAMIEDRIENGPFLLAVPSLKGVPMHVEHDDEIYLVFYRETGRFIAQMSVIGLERRENTRYMWLLQKTRAQKNQRREAYRLPVRFSVSLYKYEEDIERAIQGGIDEQAKAMALETADSKDLSITGIALITKQQYTPGDSYVMIMQLEGATTNIRPRRIVAEMPPLQLTATVRRSIPWRATRKFDTGMQFFGLTRNTSEEISRFILAEQQMQIRMRRR